MSEYGEGFMGLWDLLSKLPGCTERCLDSALGYAAWPRYEDGIHTAGPAAVEALGFTITERSPNGWRATFSAHHKWKRRPVQLICNVGVENCNGVPLLVARYREESIAA
jgi:hypothetical protein